MLLCAICTLFNLILIVNPGSSSSVAATITELATFLLDTHNLEEKPIASYLITS